MTYHIGSTPFRSRERGARRARCLTWLLLTAVGPLAAEVTDTRAVTLHYRAFLAGAPVGAATVTVSVGEGRYRVEGDARSNGWLHGFTRWRNRFSAHGRVRRGGEAAHSDGEAAAPLPVEFSYTESDADKRRHLVMRDGVLQVTKNGRQRPPRPSPAGPDVVTALFVAPRCHDAQVVNTGRHVYRLSRLAREARSCRYTVTDDDGDSVEMHLTLERHGGLLVPGRITVRGWLTGSLELVEAVPGDGEGVPGSSAAGR